MIQTLIAIGLIVALVATVVLLALISRRSDRD